MRPPIRVLAGPSAYSGFRLQQLAGELGKALPGLCGLSARYLHFVVLEAPQPDAGQWRRLERLLDYGAGPPESVPAVPTLVVTPRLGTRSPWSSKATEIAWRCGLTGIQRLERGVAWRAEFQTPGALDADALAILRRHLHDPMTESHFGDLDAARCLFDPVTPAALARVPLRAQGREALVAANRRFGLALSGDEIDYLVAQYQRLDRDPSDAELMMFAQVNSEHCRHKIFNADWVIDGQPQAQSLFAMIRRTHAAHPGATLSAYHDNAAVVEGLAGHYFHPAPDSRVYAYHAEPVHLLCKVETHNHPTAIAPYPGAATGAGGEIRDAGATGRGGKPKAGLTGFAVSNLHLPGAAMPWEDAPRAPARLATPLAIMRDGPIGAAAFNNEFGRPNLGGYFRTFELATAQGRRGYHKPIMIAGGLGSIRDGHVHKQAIAAGARIVVLGGPAMLIGLGGGAASSVDSGASAADLDFASVQRGNPEMQRRCQEVIDRCRELGADNPIVSIHDVGAGGLSNALPELVHDAGRGGSFELRRILSDEPGLSPMQIWCNEAQERYVLAVAPADLARFEAICRRERALYAVVGTATGDGRLVVTDAARPDGHAAARPIEVDMDLLFGKPPKLTREVHSRPAAGAALELDGVSVAAALERVLCLPGVADKSFLITIGDRSVSGLVSRDPMVGPWQVPVADAAVTLAGYRGFQGEAMAMGERPPLALLSGPASGRMAVAEALTNLLSAPLPCLDQVALSANWMAAAGVPGEDAILYETVTAVSEFCTALGVCIPVGKDSLSMHTAWKADGETQTVTAPLSLVVTAFAALDDVRGALTPQLVADTDTELLLVDLGVGRNRLGGSALAQVYGQLGDAPPDLVDAGALRRLAAALAALRAESLLLAYHDRSDGGLVVTLLEMAFAGRAGLDIELAPESDPLAALFSEEIGVVLQVRRRDHARVRALLAAQHLDDACRVVARPRTDARIRISAGEVLLLDRPRHTLHQLWSWTSWQMRRLRDDPECADAEYQGLADDDDPGLSAQFGFALHDTPRPVGAATRPRVAILREQGVNGHVEMAAVFDHVGFEAVDVTLSDLEARRHSLDDFRGLVACGGFSYGDVLGAGGGWARSILFNDALRDAFQAFFARPDSFALGVCNGCQMFAELRELIPGAGHWPSFTGNRSGQFEAREVMVTVADSPSLLFAGMAGSRLPVVVAHGEGRAWFRQPADHDALRAGGLAALAYADHHGTPTERYPFNPNGSPHGITGATTPDGRVTILMPHPERVWRRVQHSWAPPEWGEYGPWTEMFRNAFRWASRDAD